MRLSGILFQDVRFEYDAMMQPLFDGLTAHFPTGWTGIVGVNGAGKTTLLRLATGDLTPQEGTVLGTDGAIYCSQRTDDAPAGLNDLVCAMDGDAFEIRGRLGLQDEWPARWKTLSHGERKRAQIAVALWRRPRVLAVDEPTNHLDVEAQMMVSDALRTFQGVGLLVSHDRDLLDLLCSQCLFVDPPEATMRPGGVTAGMQQGRLEEETALREREVAKRTYRKLAEETVKRRDAAAQQQKRRSKRGLGKDNDARFKRNLARISGKDGTGGKLLRQLDGRLHRAQEKLDNARVKKTHDLGIWLPGTRSRRDLLFGIAGGSLSLGETRRLTFPDLMMRPDDRVALTGPNGAGKSTLLRHIVQSLNVPDAHVTYVPQEIDALSSRKILERARNLPRDELGRMMTAVSRLGSRPERLLESAEPSPGEARKILLATGIAQTPHLIVMDEPTNHLDLASIECLEAALADCPCGLLLVSHDRRFLKRLTRRRWDIGQVDAATFALEEVFQTA